MYALATRLINLPVISLQTGETIATIAGLVIDPDRLKLVAMTLNVNRSPRSLLVLASIRQLALDCVVIDSDEELSEPGDVIRMTPLLEANYSPITKRVITDVGRALGSVDDFTINLETDQVQKLYVHPPLLRAWFSSSLIIDRAQIIDVQPTVFIVKDTLQYASSLSPDTGSAKPS